MDLRQLEYFQMVSRLNNMTRAAERLHVAQPAISVAIQKLEEELGVQLFDRSQKQFALTTEGRVFLERTEEILVKVQDAVLEMSDYRELRRGSLRLGVPPMIGSCLFPHFFAGFRQLYPQLELHVTEEGSLSLRSLLEAEALDLGIVITSKVSDRLAVQPITTGEILVCVSPQHRLAGLDTVEFSQLSEEPFILLKEDTYHRQIILQECKKHQFNPHIVLSSSQVDTIRGLVAKGVGISFLLEGIAKKDSSIHCLHLHERLTIEIGLVWKKDRCLSRAAQTFKEFMQAIVR